MWKDITLRYCRKLAKLDIKMMHIRVKQVIKKITKFQKFWRAYIVHKYQINASLYI